MQVVNGKTDGFIGKDKIYIGRGTKKLPRSPLANPYSIGFDGNREQVIKLYREWLWYQINISEHNPNGALKKLLAMARLVKGGKPLILTCYCAPLACHGDVIRNAILWLIRENKV
ncbi:DUF4326 domain-containing protein [Microcoleus sp. A006_D1]|uniref:DUF4326 domain-containing protein n=1 Tax=Microcoleus sp. A006_D1 TaxID=3055267 RepID=UPI002FD1FEDE